jgi:hypothetical protein
MPAPSCCNYAATDATESFNYVKTIIVRQNLTLDFIFLFW